MSRATSQAQVVRDSSASILKHTARLSDLSFGWQAGRPPVLEFNALDVAHGEHLFVGGSSGSGKTTMLGLFSGILVPQSGTVEMLGTEINTLLGAERDRFRADHVGYIHQLFNLVPYLTVLGNVTLPCRFSKRRQQRACAQSESPAGEARRLLSHLGLGEAGLLRRPVTELSVGQQQRVAAARALIGSPEVLLADEPTSALDAANRQSFIELLFRECAAAGTSLVFVSHDFSLAPMFDRSIQLEGGGPC